MGNKLTKQRGAWRLPHHYYRDKESGILLCNGTSICPGLDEGWQRLFRTLPRSRTAFRPDLRQTALGNGMRQRLLMVFKVAAGHRIASRARVAAFSLATKLSRATRHSSRETTLGSPCSFVFMGSSPLRIHGDIGVQRIPFSK